MDWRGLTGMPDAELARLDVAAVNWCVGADLPGCGKVSLPDCTRAMDDLAVRCRRFTTGLMPRFHAGQTDYPDSEAKFRIQAMITHLQRDLGVRYRPDRIAEDAVFESADSFVHGILQGTGGTCGSMPVLYAAVGRRLGYPIQLVKARQHLFCRWVGTVGFNIEGSGHGVSFLPDDHYRTGRFQVPAKEATVWGYLQPLSPREELADFLVQRGECWRQDNVLGKAVESYVWAAEVEPHAGRRAIWAGLGGHTARQWQQWLHARVPSPLFPKLDIGLPTQKFQGIGRQGERDWIALRILESVLDDAEYERKWWEPLRRNPSVRPAGMPEVLRVNYRWNQPAVTGKST